MSDRRLNLDGCRVEISTGSPEVEPGRGRNTPHAGKMECCTAQRQRMLTRRIAVHSGQSALNFRVPFVVKFDGDQPTVSYCYTGLNWTWRDERKDGRMDGRTKQHGGYEVQLIVIITFISVLSLSYMSIC